MGSSYTIGQDYIPYDIASLRENSFLLNDSWRPLPIPPSSAHAGLQRRTKRRAIHWHSQAMHTQINPLYMQGLPSSQLI